MFMASQAGDSDSSRTIGLTAGVQGSMNVRYLLYLNLYYSFPTVAR